MKRLAKRRAAHNVLVRWFAGCRRFLELSPLSVRLWSRFSSYSVDTRERHNHKLINWTIKNQMNASNAIRYWANAVGMDTVVIASILRQRGIRFELVHEVIHQTVRFFLFNSKQKIKEQHKKERSQNTETKKKSTNEKKNVSVETATATIKHGGAQRH